MAKNTGKHTAFVGIWLQMNYKGTREWKGGKFHGVIQGAASRYVESQLFGVRFWDSASVLAALALVAALVLLGAWIPARGALRHGLTAAALRS